MQLLEQYFQALYDRADLLQTWRKRAWDRLQELGFPPKSKEDFKYVPLKHLVFPALASFPEQSYKAADHQILFVDGFFHSAQLTSSLVCTSLDEAMRTYGLFLQNRFARSLKDETDPFAVMNGALHGRGAFLYVPPDTHIDIPIEIHHRITSSQMGLANLQIFLGKGASLKLMQTVSEEVSSTFSNIRIDVALDEGASLFFGDRTKLSESSIFFQTFRSTLKKRSDLHFLSLNEGAKIFRSSLKVQLLEEESAAKMQGLWNLEQEKESHTHIIIEHLAPLCTSRQHFKGILKDKSRSSFEGKIFVAPVAQKTEAYQLNNNLLLSEHAIARTKPNLEIFADDVKASHGATISQLQEEELFYLRSRGISKETSDEMLTEGFVQEILQSAPASLQGAFQ